MAEILKNNSFMALPSSIKRGNPAPLDVTEIWFSYDEMANYAATNATAYVGQQMALVDEVNNTATAYIILNTAGDLQEIGTGVLTDNLSVTINNESVLHLYDYGVKYYKFIKAVGEEGAEDYIAAHYESQLVDNEHPWTAGLEPRVVLEGEDLVLGWYEPNPTTVEGVQSQVTTIQSNVENLEETLNGEGGLVDQVEDLQEEIGTAADEAGNSATGLYALLDTKADKETTYTKTETNALIAATEHLKRKIFESIEKAQEFIDANSDTADQYIYMIPTGLQYDSNRYYEYMVIDGTLEPVGQWEVDMADYFTEDELKTYLESYYDSTQIDTILTAYAKSSDLEGYYKAEQVNTLLEKYYTQEQLDILLEKYVIAEEGKSLVSDTEIIKLGTIKENAEENFIKSVEQTQFAVSEAGQLSLTSEITNSLLTESDKAKLNALVIEDNKVEISGTVNAANVQDLDSWIIQTIASNRDTADGLFSIEQENKLNDIEIGAQKNFITSIEENQFTVTDGHLAFTNAFNQQIEELSEVSNLQATKILNLENIINGYTDDEGNKNLGLVEIVNNFSDTYLTLSDFNNVVGDLNQMKNNNINLWSDIRAIQEVLKWQPMSEE